MSAVYVVLTNNEALVDFARAVQKRGMNENGEYVILAAEKDEVYDQHSYEKFCERFVDDDRSLDDGRKACRSLMIVAPNYPKYDEFAKDVLNRSSERPFHLPVYRGVESLGITVPIYAGLARDAVLLLAAGMTKVMTSKQNETENDPRNGTQVIKAVFNTEYRSEYHFECLPRLLVRLRTRHLWSVT